MQPLWIQTQVTDSWALFVDASSVYAPELEVMQEDEDADDDSASAVTVWRFALKRTATCCNADDCTKTHLVPYGFPQRSDLPYGIHVYKEWFSDDLASVAQSAGRDVHELRAAFCSDDVIERVYAYLDLGLTYGFDNLDNYPIHMSAKEFAARWE